MSANLQRKTLRSISNAQEGDSLLSSYKRGELREKQILLEKAMFYMDVESRKTLRKELKIGNPTLDFLLLRERAKPGLDRELKKFLIGLKKKTEPVKVLKENKENIKVQQVKSITCQQRKPKKVLITLTEFENNKEFCKGFFSPNQKNSDGSTKMSDFDQVFSAFESPKVRFCNFGQFKEQIIRRIEKEQMMAEEIRRAFREKNYEIMIAELFREKGLNKISNSYFRYKLSPHFPNDSFLNRLFSFCDLKSDGLLDINEFGLSLQALFLSTPMRDPLKLLPLWSSLSKFQNEYIETPNSPPLNICDIERKGFLTFWDLFLREAQHNDLAKHCNFIG